MSHGRVQKWGRPSFHGGRDKTRGKPPHGSVYRCKEYRAVGFNVVCDAVLGAAVSRHTWGLSCLPLPPKIYVSTAVLRSSSFQSCDPKLLPGGQAYLICTRKLHAMCVRTKGTNTRSLFHNPQARTSTPLAWDTEHHFSMCIQSNATRFHFM